MKLRVFHPEMKRTHKNRGKSNEDLFLSVWVNPGIWFETFKYVEIEINGDFYVAAEYLEKDLTEAGRKYFGSSNISSLEKIERRIKIDLSNYFIMVVHALIHEEVVNTRRILVDKIK